MDDLAKWWAACGGGAKRPKGTKAEVAKAIASLVALRAEPLGGRRAETSPQRPSALTPVEEARRYTHKHTPETHTH